MPAALITGVGRRRGLGAAIATRLAADGFDLALGYHADYDRRVMHERADAEELAVALRSEGHRVEVLPGDLADPQVPPALVDEARARLGCLDALVMSHCESVDSDILTTTVESFDQHYRVNVRASWQLLKAFAEQAGPGGGAVVALTSDHTAHNLPYGATKGALDRLVVAGATELGERHIRCNVLNPGPADTGWMDEALRRELAAATPGGSLGTPEDVARMVSFLVGPQGRWINGQRLFSDGGFNPTPC